MNARQGTRLLKDLAPEDALRLSHRAGEWHVRRQLPGWSGADERALAEWLAQDPTHVEALMGVSRSWREAEQLKEMFPASYGQPRAGDADPGARRRSRPAVAPPAAARAAGWSRRQVGASALAAVLTAVISGGWGWHRWENTASYTADIATAAGEQRSIDLPDGSHVALNANSRLQVRYYPHRRETVLDKGEAFFTVAADAGSPFTVDSGSHQVRVVGTAFNVRAAPPDFAVQVQHGRVELRSRTRPDAPVLALGPGAGVAIDPDSGQRRDQPVAPQAVAEWRTGQIYFQRAPLQQVARELSRYLDRPVQVDGAALQNLPVSGLMALKEPERFLLALPSIARVRVERGAEGGWLITAR